MLRSPRPPALGGRPVIEIVIFQLKEISSSLLLRRTSFASGSVVGKSLVVVGGRTGGTTTTDRTQIFSGNSWTFGPSLPLPLEQHCTVTLNSTHLLVTGGLSSLLPILRFDGGIILDVRNHFT